MFGDTAFHPYAMNTFSGNGKEFTILTPIHYVKPHHVKSHFRNGSFIAGYWRDGDGNTRIDRETGYYSRNPNAIIHVLKLRGKR